MRHRWFLLSLVVDRDAELVYIIGKDVHASREASERLGDAEARFRSAFENSAIGITITGFDRRFVRVNSAFADMVGRSVEELDGAPVADVSHADESDADRALVDELVADPGGIVQREKRYLRPDGSEVLAQLSVSAVAGPDGTAQYLIAQMVDVTQQRAAERALAESEQRFRTLAVASPAGIFSLDFKGRIVYANNRLCEIFGMDPAEGDGWQWLERGDPHSRAPLIQVAESLAAGGGRGALDIKLTPDAGARWVRIHVATVIADRRFIGAIDDVSAEVEARNELALREAEYRVLAEHSGDCLSRHDLEGRYLYV